MKRLITKVNRGSLVRDVNRNRKPSEAPVYYSFWLEADDKLVSIHGFPKADFYMLTKNEFERNIRKQACVASLYLFRMGRMNLFVLGRMTVIVKLRFDGTDNVVRLPLNLLKRALTRRARNPEDAKRPGILNEVIADIAESRRK